MARLILSLVAAVATLGNVGCGPVSPEVQSAHTLMCEPDSPPSRTISCVHSFAPGANSGFGSDRFPEVIYGEPKGEGLEKGSLDVLSLGVHGTIVVGFGGNAIVDGPGPDFIVFENAFFIGGNPEHPYAEPGELAVSSDGLDFKAFACNSAAPPFAGCAGSHPVLAGFDPTASAYDPIAAGGESFDLADVGVHEARFVRIRDRSSGGAGNTGGFDLDAIAVVNAGALDRRMQ